MKAADVMTLGAATVSPGSTVAEAAQLMLQFRISGLPVVDEGRVVGIVTERDLLRRAELGTERKRPRWAEMLIGSGQLAEEYAQAHARRVDEVMTPDVITVNHDTPLSDVVDVLEKHDIKRLPVLRDGELVGIISRANLLREVARVPEAAPPGAVDDRVIRDRIVEELERQSWAPVGAIDVWVRRGVVELRGTVGDERIRRAIRVAAENVPGVQEVNDQVQVVTYTPGWI